MGRWAEQILGGDFGASSSARRTQASETPTDRLLASFPPTPSHRLHTGRMRRRVVLTMAHDGEADDLLNQAIYSLRGEESYGMPPPTS